MIKEPKRLIESDTGPLAESLAASRLRVPSDARMAALASRLTGAGVAWGEPMKPLAGPELTLARDPLRRKPLELWSKALLAALALGGAAVVGALLWRSGAAQPPESSRAARPTSAPPAPPVLPPPAAERARASTSAIAAPARVPAALPAPANHVRAGVESTTTPGSEAPAPLGASAALAPTARAAAPANAPAAENAPASVAPRARSAEPEAKRVAPSSPTARADSAESNGERLPLPANTVVDSEVEMLKKARNALGSDPVQAYALTERCRAQYPRGAFAQERDFIAISSLVRMGRQDEARGRASLFRTRYRHSAYLPQLTRMLGEE